jgi:hypothetical protein
VIDIGLVLYEVGDFYAILKFKMDANARHAKINPAVMAAILNF